MLPGLDDMLNVGGNRIRPEKKDIWKVVLWVIGILAVFVLLALEFKWFGRLFNMGRLILIGVVLGGIIGGLVGSRFTGNAKTSLDKAQIVIMITVLGAIAMPVLLSLTNRMMGTESVEKVEFSKIEPIMEAKFEVPTETKPDAYFLYFTKDDALQKIKVKDTKFLNAKHGSTIDLPIIEGLLGFDLINLK